MASMFTERISLTMAPGGENHSNQFIGRCCVKGEGFKHSDIDLMADQMRQLCLDTEVLNLNELSGNATIKELGDEDRLCPYCKELGEQRDYCTDIRRMPADHWDSKYLDPNKYRTEIVYKRKSEVRL